jgi:hypothetical protein
MVNKEWLKSALRKSDKTTLDLAHAIRRDRAVVSRIINGKQPATLEQAKSFAATIDHPVADVLVHLGLADGETAQVFNSGFAESDAIAWVAQGSRSKVVQSTAESLGGNKPGIDVWSAKSSVLSQMGIMQGDFLLIDTLQAERCKAGDVVIAQIYERDSDGATTVLRRYEPPVLVAASPNPEEQRVLVVDDRNVLIRGKMIASWRLY